MGDLVSSRVFKDQNQLRQLLKNQFYIDNEKFTSKINLLIERNDVEQLQWAFDVILDQLKRRRISLDLYELANGGKKVYGKQKYQYLEDEQSQRIMGQIKVFDKYLHLKQKVEID